MPIVTITSDWSLSDYYFAALAGRLHTLCPNAQILNLNNNIQSFSVLHAALVIKNSFTFFPVGTVHLVCVNSLIRPESPLCVCAHEGRFVVSADNGIFSLFTDKKPKSVIMVREMPLSEEGKTFPELYDFAQVASALLRGESPETLGTPRTCFKEYSRLMATYDHNTISGKVLSIDSYGNLISNISRELFEEVSRGRAFTLFVQSKKNKIESMAGSYCEVAEGELFALFNSLSLLEVGINKGNLARAHELNIHAALRVVFR